MYKQDNDPSKGTFCFKRGIFLSKLVAVGVTRMTKNVSIFLSISSVLTKLFFVVVLGG
jgi:hypothetical protein